MLIVEALAAHQLVPLIRVTSGASGGFVKWLQEPNFQVDVSGPDPVLMVGDVDEFLRSVAWDVDRLLRAGRETCEAIAKLGSAPGRSPAWVAIQAYYAAFYYASATMKLCGNNLSYVRTSELKEVRRQINALVGHPSVTTGQWRFDIAPNATKISMIKPSGSDGVHETTWKEFRNLGDSVRSALVAGPYSPNEIVDLNQQLDAFKFITDGVDGLPFLSSTRNQIQYQQNLDSWTPISKINKSLDYSLLGKGAWADVDLCSIAVPFKSNLETFVQRCMGVCAISHNFAVTVGKDWRSSFLIRHYAKQHNQMAKIAA